MLYLLGWNLLPFFEKFFEKIFISVNSKQLELRWRTYLLISSYEK